MFNNILSPIHFPLFSNLFSKGGAGGFPNDITSLVVAKNGTITSKVGPDLQYSAAAGLVPDGLGGTQNSQIPPAHVDGYYAGPAYTNLCTCRKTNPIDLTGIVKEGDAASVLSIVNDSVAIAAGISTGLLELNACINGVVYKLDNSLGITNAYATINGGTSNTGYYTISVYGRAAAGTAKLGYESQNFGPIPNTFTSASYAYAFLTLSNVNSQRLRLLIAPGAVLYFILPQLVNSQYVLPTLSDSSLNSVSAVSTVGSAGGNGLSVPLTANGVVKVPDGTEIIANAADREFSSDTGFWTKGNWTISGGVAVASIVTSGEAIFKSGLATLGEWYQITFTVVSISSGGFRPYFGSASVGTIRTAPGTYSEALVLGGNGIVGICASANGTSGTVDNISIQKLIPNLDQVAKADVLIGCFQGYPDGINKIVNPTDISIAPWTSQLAITVQSPTLFTFGEQYANRRQTLTGLSSSKRYKITIRCRAVTGNTSLKIFHEDAVGGPETSINVTSSFNTFSVIKTPNTTVLNCGLQDINASGWGQAEIAYMHVEEMLPASGTVGVLAKMGVGSADISGNINLFTLVNDEVKPFYKNTSAILCGYDSSAGFAQIVSSWVPGDHYNILEYGGGKLRVGIQRIGIDGGIVWSHATLVAGATFGGSFPSTTFLRFFLTSTVPNKLKGAWVSNQANLGDTEILRRLSYVS